ncbi:MAG TPA: DUF3987 domain-containing protein [Reyranella sp.]|nr:DUF3987 domain-containing protein [Reyranella sp.]
MPELTPGPESQPRYHRELVHPPLAPDAARIIGGWPEVDAALFDDGRSAAPAFPLELLPLPWRGWVADTAAGAGAPSAYVAQALLAAVAGLSGAGAVVRLAPAWTEPLVLWQALVGRPSSGKSPALAPVRALLATLHEELDGDAEGRKPFVLLGDGAAETLADALAGAPRGAILWRDEPSGRLAFLDDGAKDRSRWLEAWQAGPVVLRGAREVARHERCPMSVLISIRPDRLMAALGKDDPRKDDPRRDDDGLAARLLYAWPDPPPFRPVAERRPARDEQALDLLRSISRVVRARADPLVLALDPAAAKAFDGFLADLHALARHAEGLEADWLGKASGTVARLAGILALLAWSGSGVGGAPGKVGLESMAAAVRLWSDFLHPHARLVFDRAGPTDRERQARRVVRWLRAHRLAEVSREDVRRHALGRSLDADCTDLVLERLCALGALRPRMLVLSAQGGRPPRRWEVNPALLAAEAGDEK